MPILQAPATPPPAVSPLTVVARRDPQVKMQCAVVADGRLADCRVLSESPAGAGAGAAAPKLAALFKMKPLTAEGRPVAGARVIIPLRFRQADTATGAAQAASPPAASAPATGTGPGGPPLNTTGAGG